jgi:ankyrin repeat protein
MYICPMEDCTFKATRKDNLRQHCIQVHKELPQTKLTALALLKPSDGSKYEDGAPGASASASQDISEDVGYSWESKIFLQAATTGDLAVIKASLTDSIDVNLRAGDGSSALHCAARAGHTAVIDLLLQGGSDINATNSKQRSPLHEALLGQSLETTKLLLRNGAYLDASDVSERCLAWSGDANIVRICLDHLSDKAPKDLMYNTLIAASRDGQDNTVKALLPLFGRSSTGSGDIERPFAFGAWENYQYSRTFEPTQSRPLSKLTRFTPLHVAAAKGHWQIVQILVDYGADINQSFKKVTALHLASARGHVETVRYILSLPGILLMCTHAGEGSTPLHSAAVIGRADIVKLLLSHADIDININSTTRKRRTPLHEAVSSGHLRVVELLLQHERTNAKLKEFYGHTPLRLAAFGMHLEIANLLLNHEDMKATSKAKSQVLPQEPIDQAEIMKRILTHEDFHNVNEAERYLEDSKGCLLTGAIHNGYYACVQLILNHPDIDVNLRSGYFNETPLLVASEIGNIEIVKLLLQHKDIDINIQSWKRKTALQAAGKKGHADIVDLLRKHGAIDHDATTTPPGSSGADNANHSSVPQPHVEELSDHGLESRPYSFLDEYMEDLNGSGAMSE